MAGQYDRIIQPGETGKIPVKLATKKASGTITKTISVNTNIKGSQSSITLKITGEVWQPVQVTPRSAAFGRITPEKADEGLVRKLTIVNNVEGALKLENLSSSSPNFKAELKPLEEGKKYELVVTLIPPLNPGNNTGKITMDTGLEDKPKLDLTAYAYVTAPVDVTPTKLSLPSNRATDLQRQFYIRSNNNQPVQITDLTSSSPALQLELKDIKKSKTYRLTVDIPTTYKPPPAGDKITFKTDNPSVPLITIPIVGRNATPSVARRPNSNKQGLKNAVKQNLVVGNKKKAQTKIDSSNKKNIQSSTVKKPNRVFDEEKGEPAVRQE